MIGNRQASSFHHGKVVCSIPHGYAFVQFNAETVGSLSEHALLLGTVADIAPILGHYVAREQAVFDFKQVGSREIDTESVPYPVGEKRKAATDEQYFESALPAGSHEVFCARIHLQAMLVDFLKCTRRHAFEQRNALSQTGLEVGDFSTHGRFCDGRDFCFFSGNVSNFVNALNVDECRVHVKGNQFEVCQ